MIRYLLTLYAVALVALISACSSTPARDDHPTTSHCAQTAEDGSRYFTPCP